MLEIINYVKARYMNEKAQGIVEYALILTFVVGIAIYITSGDSALAKKIKDCFDAVASELQKPKAQS